MFATRQQRHHYIPRFYLAGFTASGRKDDKLYQFDLEQHRTSKRHPTTVAYRWDFYKIDVPGFDPSTVEDLLAKVEYAGAGAIRQIQQRQGPPDEARFADLMYFVALMMLRTPAYRQWLLQNIELYDKIALRSMVATPKSFDKALRQMRERGHLKSEVSYETMKRFVGRDNYSIQVPREGLIHYTLEFLAPMSVVLSQRSWSVILADDAAGDLICSDQPVALRWTVTNPPFPSPGLLMPYTELTMPLNRTMALISSFEIQIPVLPAGRPGIAALNARTAAAAQRYIYSPHEDFIWMQADGSIGSASEYVRPSHD